MHAACMHGSRGDQGEAPAIMVNSKMLSEAQEARLRKVFIEAAGDWSEVEETLDTPTPTTTLSGALLSM